VPLRVWAWIWPQMVERPAARAFDEKRARKRTFF
jgi:hypothetical protein